jgi:CHAT domain-containing protein
VKDCLLCPPLQKINKVLALKVISAAPRRTALILSISLILATSMSFDTMYGAYAVEGGFSTPPAPAKADTTKVTTSASIGNSNPAQLNLQQLPPNLLDMQQTPESLEKVQKLEQEGEQFFSKRILDRALAKWQEAYGLSLEMKYAEGEGRALTNMCRIFIERGQMVKAKYMGENAVEVLAGINDHKALGRAHLFLSQAYFGLDNPVWAGQQLDAALSEFNADGTGDSIDTAHLMDLAASILIKMGKIKESLQFYQAAATYYGQAGDTIQAVNTQVRVTDMLLGIGLLTAASEQSEKALSLARSTPDKPELLVSALASQANCKYTLGEFAQAKKIYEQVFQTIKAVPNKVLSPLGQANIDLGYGSTLAALGEYDQARQVFERTLAIYKTNGASLSQAQTSNVLGVTEESLGHHDKARAYLEQAIDLQNVITPKQDAFHLLALQNLAVLESRTGRNRDARARLETAVSLAKKLKDNTTLGRLYVVQAEVIMRLADEPEAEKVLRAALTISEQVNDDSALWRQHTMLAKIEIGQGNTTQARDSLESALSFFRSPQANHFPQPEKIPYVTPRADMAEQLVAALASEKMTEQALLATEQFKEESFICDWTNRGGQVKPDDQDIYSELSLQRAHLHAAEVSSSPKMIQKDWKSWLDRFRTVTRQNRSLARLIGPVPTTSGEILKGVQKSNATVIEYMLGMDSSVIFTINGAGRMTATVIPVGRKKIETQVTSLLSAVPRSGEAPNPQAALAEKRILQTLYAELLPTAVRAFLPADPEQRLIIIPDGPLSNLPFAALVTEQSKYLVEAHTILTAPSIVTLLDTPPRYVDDFSLLVATSEGGSDAEEAKAIAGAFSAEGTTALIGKEAELKAIPDQVHGKSCMHIAGPVNFGEPDPLKATIPLKGDGGKPALAERLSGLSLLTDVSVWSGASVSPKDVNGDAVRLFSRGLNYAGTRNVLLSLWTVPAEERTNELLDFYKNKQGGMSPAESLRKAELQAIARDGAPHSWAAFQMVGVGH